LVTFPGEATAQEIGGLDGDERVEPRGGLLPGRTARHDLEQDAVADLPARAEPTWIGGFRQKEGDVTFRGRVRDGQVVLDPPSRLPEGVEVLVQVLKPEAPPPPLRRESPLMRYAGQAKGLAEDASETIDRVLSLRT
jgi:hypothetical protein